MQNITHTQGGFEVKNLKYNLRDNIYVALVKDLIYGNELRDYWVCVQFYTNGTPMKSNKGRTELNIKL